MPELQISGIAMVPVIVALVQLARVFGLSKEYAWLANALLSVLVYILIVLIQGNPALAEPVNIVLNGLVIFLASAGFYDRAQAIARRRG